MHKSDLSSRQQCGCASTLKQCFHAVQTTICLWTGNQQPSLSACTLFLISINKNIGSIGLFPFTSKRALLEREREREHSRFKIFTELSQLGEFWSSKYNRKSDTGGLFFKNERDDKSCSTVERIKEIFKKNVQEKD